MSDIQSPTIVAADREKIFGVIREISNAMIRIDSEREFIKEALGEASEKYQLKKKYLSKLAKTYHKQSYKKEREDIDTFTDLYETIVEPNASDAT